ncbi:E3 ubiquitin-protein ligase BRE1-like 2 isoform X2 [Andrographis paniculata]|uniref:E3 ubiquitin-protein ligase BRE1-like 2 isoform X2 n=1 Tax=Andrographis paniculata TaxID=175694 RepID=UPI0021E8DC88|nr:E3 ubiquitin-protein ligase BRE1-like 2 isoform X2 [Andrographis paniculata]
MEPEEEPQQKRPHLDNNDSSMARHSSSPPPDDNKPVDAAVLQYQNQKLVQQLETQKHGLHDLELKIQELKEKQTAYDDLLINVNQQWNQLIDDIILLGAQAGAAQSALQSFNDVESSRGSIPSCPAEDIFLCRLLQTESKTDGSISYIKETLASRQTSTREMMKLLENAIHSRRTKLKDIARIFSEKPSAEDAVIQLRKLGGFVTEETNWLNEVIEVLHLKQKQYADEIETRMKNHLADQLEIKRLAGEVEESLAELEESRRKLINLKMQKDGVSGIHVPIPIPAIVPNAVNGTISPEKHTDRSKRLRELKESLEAAKLLAEDRLSEIEDAQEDNKVLSKQLQALQDELKEEKYVYTSRPYSFMNEQLQHWNAEAERCRASTESVQAEKHSNMRKLKEVTAKLDSIDAARNAIVSSESKLEELQNQLQTTVAEKNELEMKLEEVMQDLGRKDVREEFEVMSSALSKEMEMMETQLHKWKNTADEALSLREKAHSLNALLNVKTTELTKLADDYVQERREIKSLKDISDKMQKENQELEIFLDMLGQQIYDNRSLAEIKESEHRARLQAETLKSALDEHSLELRVKAAYEAEAACHQRLSVAEAEIAELRAELDASDRDVLELKAAIKIKEGDAESYISEIETIGQAYEDMQAQNQRLLHLVTERDEFNIKLVSDSVKAKQSQSILLSEKEGLANQLKQVNGSLEALKSRINHFEEQMKVHFPEALSVIQEERPKVNYEVLKWQLTEAEKEHKMLKSCLLSSEKEHEQLLRKIDDVKIQLNDDRSEGKKLDEEVDELKRRVDELTEETGEAAIQKLQDEIKDCKAIIKCGVCFDRPKEVVIVKCFHLFCNQCIQRNLEIRHRKCPGCGTAFGQNDVRFVKI